MRIESGINLLVLLILGLTISSCSDDDAGSGFNGLSLIGEWDVTTTNYFGLLDGELTEMSRGECVFIFEAEGDVKKQCPNAETTVFSWFYRESFNEVVLIDYSVLLSNVLRYQVIESSGEYHRWEESTESISIQPSGDTLIYINLRRLELYRR